MSLISDSRCWPLVKMSPVSSCWVSLIWPIRPSLSASEKPMMAFSGVRSSCDMVARNSDFMRLACSSSTFFSSSVRSKRLRSVTSRAAANTPCSLRSRSWKVAALYDTTVSSPFCARTVSS